MFKLNREDILDPIKLEEKLKSLDHPYFFGNNDLEQDHNTVLDTLKNYEETDTIFEKLKNWIFKR
jgi:hypothetical protein